MGERALGCWLTFPSVHMVELIAMAGFDFVQIDGEHGPFTLVDVELTCIAAGAVGLTVTARVPDLGVGTIVSYLDRGVQGIMGPHVETPEEAAALAGACRFAPEGERSWGGGRSLGYNDPAAVGVDDGSRADFMARANSEMIVTAQLESAAGLEAIDDLLAVPGIDYFAFGPNDLAQSLGLAGRPDSPEVTAAMARTVERVHAAGRRMAGDDMKMAYAHGLFLDAGRAFVKSE